VPPDTPRGTPFTSAFNDGLKASIKTSVYVTEFFFHDADEQLKTGMTYWGAAAH